MICFLNYLIFLMFFIDTNSLQVPQAEEIFKSFPPSLTVSFKDFAKKVRKFETDDLIDFQPILIDTLRRRVIVGARDAVVVLDGETMSVVDRIDWPAKQRDIDVCQMKGQLPEDCHNFVRTLATHGDRTLICGTHAFAPLCTWRQSSDLGKIVEESFDGIGTSPHSPFYHSEYVMTPDGQMFTGIVTDFSGHDSSILRIFPANKLLRTAKANNRWINDPEFVAAFEDGNFVYFFFRETAVETSSCGEKRLSRVARMCKNDVGGDLMLQGTWTTFSKATITCPMGDSTPFTHLQDVVFDPASSNFYATFTHSRGELKDSAVCVYNMTSLKTAFGGPFLLQSNPDTPWTQHPNNYPYFDCEVKGVTSARPGMTKRPLPEAHRYQLMANAVQPATSRPLHHAPLETYSHLLVDTVRVKHHGVIQVLLVVTSSGLLKKYSILPESTVTNNTLDRTCLVEVVQIAQTGQPLNIQSIEYFKAKESLIIGTTDSVMRVSVERCWRFGSRDECIQSQDPYCGWNSNTKKCTRAPGKITTHHYWHQNLVACPRTDIPVDGEFGDWSDWFQCPREDIPGQTCDCRRRECDSPSPRLKGAPCKGSNLQVSNCTRDGNWTSWTPWSPCSSSCGAGVHSRRRECSNPSPAHRGKECLGSALENKVCLMEDCPMATVPPVHGGWSEWTAWQTCSRECGGGIRKRTRSCNNPTPANDGSACAGCHQDYQTCNTEPCQEVRRWTDWTPWLQANSSSDNRVFVKRYKFACRARIDDPKLMSVSRPRVQEKMCSKDNDCTDTAFAAVDGGWSSWTEWNVCSRSCANGTQSRLRTCSSPSPSSTGLDCPEHAKEIRQCNSHACEAKWGCWSDYSDCTVTCGKGVRHRVRKCDRPNGELPCLGDRIDTIQCSADPCSLDGYGTWSGWSACGELGVKVRIRPCISDTYCSGIPDAQMKKCYSSEGNVLASTSDDDRARLPLYLGIVAAFVCGCALTLLISCWAVRSRSNCCYSPVNKPPPAPIVTKANIYSQPPDKLPQVTVNPLTQLLSEEKALELAELDALNNQGSMSLRRTMRASLNPRDYL